MNKPKSTHYETKTLNPEAREGAFMVEQPGNSNSNEANNDRPMSGLLSEAPRRVILVGVDSPDNDWPIEESLDELAQLASTAGVTCVDRIIQRMSHPHPATLLGSGKVREIAELVQFHDCD